MDVHLNKGIPIHPLKKLKANKLTNISVAGHSCPPKSTAHKDWNKQCGSVCIWHSLLELYVLVTRWLTVCIWRLAAWQQLTAFHFPKPLTYGHAGLDPKQALSSFKDSACCLCKLFTGPLTYCSSIAYLRLLRRKLVKLFQDRPIIKYHDDTHDDLLHCPHARTFLSRPKNHNYIIVCLPTEKSASLFYVPMEDQTLERSRSFFVPHVCYQL